MFELNTVFTLLVKSIGRQLLGFTNVSDWDKIRSELTRRGHGVGAIHQLPVFKGGL